MEIGFQDGIPGFSVGETKNRKGLRHDGKNFFGGILIKMRFAVGKSICFYFPGLS